MRCEQARHQILQQTLEGEFVPAAPLAGHLQGCPDCRGLLARVRLVDGALRAPPLEQMPAWSVHQVIARLAAESPRQEAFLPWTLWLPIGSLLAGLLWAYVTLVWPAGPAMTRSADPSLLVWLTQLEGWVFAQQAMLNVVALSVGGGLLLTALAVGLGVYVGRDRIVARHSP